MGLIAFQGRSADVADLAAHAHDVIVVGGGIYGAMVHLEAARAGLRSVLVERADFAGATSASSLRIIHGGLRYLKDLDLGRSLESTRERLWYRNALPELVTTLPCMLPLYDRRPLRARAIRVALGANDAIGTAVARFGGVAERDVPPGYMLDARAALEAVPGLPPEGLAGAAVWHDLLLRCPARVVIEALTAAAGQGGIAVNYVEARGLVTKGGAVAGLTVRDAATRASAELAAPVVVDAAGPWMSALADRWGVTDMKPEPLVVAWNVLLDRPALSNHAVALRDPLAPKAGLKFATSLGGRMLVGTGYAALRSGDCDAAEDVAEAELDAFLSALNRCVPTLRSTRRDVLRIFSGALPAAAPGSVLPRAQNRVRAERIRGLYTISGTKFTTARSAARRAVGHIARSGLVSPREARDAPGSSERADVRDVLYGEDWTMADVEARRSSLQRLIEREAVEHLDDLVLRRTTLGDQPVLALAAARSLCALDERWRRAEDAEVARLVAQLHWRQTAWAMNKASSG